MVLLKYMFLVSGFAFIAGAIAIVVVDVLAAIQFRRLLAAGSSVATLPPHSVRLRLATTRPNHGIADGRI